MPKGFHFFRQNVFGIRFGFNKKIRDPCPEVSKNSKKFLKPENLEFGFNLPRKVLFTFYVNIYLRKR